MISAYEPFSKKLQDALQNDNVTIAKIAKESGLETYHVQELVKGTTIPTIWQEHKIDRAINSLRCEND